MEQKWYEKPMRIAALQCNFENGQNLAVIDKWLAAGFNTEQLFHPMADAYSALYDPEKHAPIITSYVAKARANGLRIIVYMNVHILGPSIANHRDTWGQHAADSSIPLLYDTYPACCVNSPWRDYYFRSLTALTDYDIDGVFLDGPVVVSGGCFCDSCRQKYHNETGGDLVTASEAERHAFYQRSLYDFLMSSYRFFKERKPAGAHYMNLPVLHPTASYQALPQGLDYNDIVGTEGGFMFYGPAKEAYLWRPSLAAKVLEAVAPDKSRVIFMAADQKPWAWIPHTPAETKLCIASSVANGANVWYGFHGSSALLKTPGGKAGTEMMHFLAKHEDVYEKSQSIARVAVLYSLDTEHSYRAQTELTDFYGNAEKRTEFLGDMAQSVQGVFDLLTRSSIPFDMVTELDLSESKLSRYDLLILPTSACMSEKTTKAIKQYVANGGTVLATLDTSLYDEHGRQQADFTLADVFGCSYGGSATKYPNFNYISFSKENELFEGIDNLYLPALGVGLSVQPKAQAKILARFHKPMAGRYVEITEPDQPAMIFNQYGKGHCLYVAGNFGEFNAEYNPPEYRRILTNIVKHYASPTVTIEGSLGNIELVVRQQEQRLFLHLVNYAGLLPRPFEAIAPQSGLKAHISLPGCWSRAKALSSDTMCPSYRLGKELVVDLPVIHEYEVIVVE